MTDELTWARVAIALAGADSITWDGCHKIYVLMDPAQTEDVRDSGYRPVLKVTDVGSAFETLRDWYAKSCPLRFISAVKTVEGDANDGFTNLIPQFEED